MFKSSNIHTPHSKPIEDKGEYNMKVSQPVNGGESSSDSTQSSEKDKTSAMSDKQAENRETSDSEQRYEEYQGDISKTGAPSAFGRGHNPVSQANLKPFPKGTSGNPSGRHKKSLEFVDALIEHGKKIGIRHKSSFTTGEESLIDEGSYNFQVVDNVWQRARQGELPYIKLLHELGVLKPTTEEVKEDHESSAKYWADFAEKIEERKVRRELEQAERFDVE